MNSAKNSMWSKWNQWYRFKKIVGLESYKQENIIFFQCILIYFWVNLQHFCFDSKTPSKNWFHHTAMKQQSWISGLVMRMRWYSREVMCRAFKQFIGGECRIIHIIQSFTVPELRYTVLLSVITFQGVPNFDIQRRINELTTWKAFFWSW